jgi:hypothetical protein
LLLASAAILLADPIAIQMYVALAPAISERSSL